MFLYSCNDITLLNTILFVKSLLNVLFLIIPIILIVIIVIDIVKMVVGKEEDFKRIPLIIMKRLIAVIILFFVPLFVSFILTKIGQISNNKLACYDEANVQNIERLERANVDNLINGINPNELTLSDINNISKSVSKISNKKIRKEYEDKLQEIKDNYNKKQAELEKEESVKKNQGSNSDSNIKYDKTLFVGDSRTVGMCLSVNLKSGQDCSIAKSSTNYSWFESTALPNINSKLSADQKYNVIINMGTNDLGYMSHASMYANKYNNLKKKYPKANIIAVSVGPIYDSKVVYMPNVVNDSNVVEFNQKLKKNLDSSVKYCNIYNEIKGSFNASDGVHYDTNTYKKIYELLNNCI